MTDLSGQWLSNQYQLKRLVGSGASADVYLADDKIRATAMAIKILRPDLALTPRFSKMFEDEAHLLKELNHPNIIRFFEFIHDKGLAFIVMEWVDGSDLRRRIKENRRPLPLKEVAGILRPVCTALNFAHKSNYIHCDIKPSNILLHKDGRVLLTDFGVAKFTSEKNSGGTPPYMAPEQFTGDPIDQRTDIYALGVTLYEMLSGGLAPFRGDSPESMGSTLRARIAWEHLNKPLPPLTQFNSAVSDSIENVVETAMSKEPGLRYESALKMLDAFEYACKVVSHPYEDRTTWRPEQVSRHDPQPGPPIPRTPEKNNPRERIAYGPPKGPHLFCKRGMLKGQAIPLLRGEITVGRSGGNMVVLNDMTVSRQHAIITRGKAGTYIRDLNSKFGTMVNGTLIKNQIKLRPGDIIQIGIDLFFEYREY